MSDTTTSTVSNGLTGYEGAMQSEARSSFLMFPTNARRELNRFTRRELVRKARALDANLGIFGRIKTKIGQHSVGRGIFPRPITRDKEWNDANRRRFEKWMSNSILYSVEETYDGWEDQRFCAETMIGDGEHFTGLVEKNGRKCTQRFDTYEIESPALRSLGSDTGTLTPPWWADGVHRDEYDAPLGYGVRELPRDGSNPSTGAGYARGKVREIEAASMLHVFHHRRAHQGRGLTWFYSGINNGIDALDVVALEKGTAKLHALLGLAVRKKEGQADTKGIAGQISKILDGDGKVSRVDENFWRGAAIQYLQTDEGIDLVQSNRPSPNLLAFLEFLYREISIGLGLPLEVVYNLAALSGPSVRAVLEDAQFLFDGVQDKIVMRHSQRIYLWNTALAMQRGELQMCQDPEWWACAWRGPAKLTVDLGRTADAAIKLMKNAALSHVRYYEERNQDPYDEMMEEITFRAWLRERCKEAGVPYEELIEPTPGAVTTVNVQPNEQPA